MEYLVTFADDTVEHILPGVLRLHFENGDISIDVREQSFAHLIDSGKNVQIVVAFSPNQTYLDKSAYAMQGSILRSDVVGRLTEPQIIVSFNGLIGKFPIRDDTEFDNTEEKAYLYMIFTSK